VGKVLFEMDGSYWVCSATVIDDDGKADRSLILTAAHCAYDETNGAFATEWMFIPDYDAIPASLTTNGSFCDSTKYGCWSAASIAVHTGYADAGSFGAGVEYDFAVVAVGAGGKSPSQLDATVAPQQVSFSEPDAIALADTYAFGYPAQKKWDGTDLIYCRGPVDTDPINNGETYRLNECKLNGGSSGGSWMVGVNGAGFGTVISVNSYGYRGITAMHGPFLDLEAEAVYDAVLSVDPVPNTVVSN
jgi:V8-like Glu-specific endopeptidase